MRDLAVVLLAAGEGARLGQNTPKAFVPLMGKPLIEHALINLVSTQGLAHVSLVAHGDYQDLAEELADRYSTEYVNIVVAPAGEVTRQDSVRNGLAMVPDDLDIVLVHDTARPFATAELFERVAAAVRESGMGVVPVLPVVDTI
jgi:2-C-methyl-D-erythritol 4-phosphate cytidylyltransferase